MAEHAISSAFSWRSKHKSSRRSMSAPALTAPIAPAVPSVPAAVSVSAVPSAPAAASAPAEAIYVSATAQCASDPRTPPQDLWELARIPELRKWIIANTAAPAALINAIAHAGGPGVRQAMQLLHDSLQEPGAEAPPLTSTTATPDTPSCDWGTSRQATDVP